MCAVGTPFKSHGMRTTLVTIEPQRVLSVCDVWCMQTAFEFMHRQSQIVFSFCFRHILFDFVAEARRHLTSARKFSEQVSIKIF